MAMKRDCFIVMLFLACLRYKLQIVIAYQDNSRIIGGEDIGIQSVPYFAQIVQMGYVICGGSIISETTILTAAHCIKHKTIANLEVYTGSEKSTQGNKYAVNRFYVHPQFNKTVYLSHDIGIIYLRGKIKLSSRAQVVNVPFRSQLPPINTTGLVIGFGMTDIRTSTYASVLQKIELPIISIKECKKFINSLDDRAYDGTQFCMGRLKEENLDACKADSGGPVVNPKTMVQFGIVSWGDGCGEIFKPGVYTDVSALSDWIRKYMFSML